MPGRQQRIQAMTKGRGTDKSHFVYLPKAIIEQAQLQQGTPVEIICNSPGHITIRRTA